MSAKGNSDKGGFSPVERQILKYLIAGLQDEQISSKTGLSEKEIKIKLREIYNQLDVKTRIAAVIKAEKLI